MDQTPRPVPEPPLSYQIIQGTWYANYTDPWDGRRAWGSGPSRQNATDDARSRILSKHQIMEEDRLTYGEGGRPSRRRTQ